ncbi:sulfatase family protein [Diplocloster hominis]|uniref:sulfatase family protein n=1 Tax=Diplocloster hominis TaxID=3079010 RepID=UPI0031BB12B1
MKPNVLVFITDQQRTDQIGCLADDSLNTPNIDTIAANGTLFRHAYCNTPLCMPSRATLWSGLTPRGHGARTNGVNTRDGVLMLPQILKDNGYETYSVGKLHLKCWHLTPEKTPNVKEAEYTPQLLPECETVWERGDIKKFPEPYYGVDHVDFLGGHGSYAFGEYYNWLKNKSPKAAETLRSIKAAWPKPGGTPYYNTVPKELYYTEWITQKTIECIENRDKEKPFFLWCSNPDPHYPFGPPIPYDTMYTAADIHTPLAFDDRRESMPDMFQKGYYERKGVYPPDGGPQLCDLQTLKEMKARSNGMVSLVDESVGRIMDHLRQNGLEHDTIVVFVSDHGDLMGDHNMYCKGPFHYEGLINVPLIFQWEGHIQKNVKTDALASLLDFVPTMLDLLEIPYPLTGIQPWPGPFFNMDGHEAENIYDKIPVLPGISLKPILTGQASKVQESVLIEDDDDIFGMFLRTLITEKYKLTLFINEEFGVLFDHEKDPEERQNLWNDPAYAEVQAQLVKKLLDKIVQTEPRLRRRYGIA